MIWVLLGALAFVVAVFAGIIFVVVVSAQAELAQWDTYAVCDCGWKQRVAFGSLFHLHHEVCPSCGQPKDCCMEVKTMRYVTGRWETKE